MIPQYIPDSFEELVDKISLKLGYKVHFDAGHYWEVTKNLQLKDGAIEESTREKYPLFWLVMDFEEEVGRSDIYAELPNIQLIIATRTEMAYTMEERRDKTFKPILYPIYNEFFNQLYVSKAFMKVGTTYPHRKWDRPYWGGQESGNSEQNLFNDHVDAIQIKLKISVKKQC